MTYYGGKDPFIHEDDDCPALSGNARSIVVEFALKRGMKFCFVCVN